MQVHKTPLPGLLVIEPKVFKDPRGFFFETFYQSRFIEAGITDTFVQDNISRSSKGVLRGLHYQLEKPQAKLVSITRGAVFDVVADVRRGSPTFGQWFGIELNEDNHKQLYIPVGFAHGFSVLSDTADFVYKCSDYYHPQSEYGVRWDDPKLNIQWNVSDPLLSEKDKILPSLDQVSPELLPVYAL